MDDVRFIPDVWRWSWWRERLLAAVAVLCALLFAYGGSLGWWVVEGQTATRAWHEIGLFPYGDRVDPNPGDAGVVIGRFMLLPCALIWVWAPFGGYVGRMIVMIAFALACHSLVADLPTFATDGKPPGVAREQAVLDALLGRGGWNWHGFDGTRSTDSIGDRVVGDLDIVALRERVQPGATLSLASAVGGLAVAGLSTVRSAFARRGGPRRRDDPPGPNEFDAEASRLYEGFTYHRTGSVDQFGR